MDSLFSPSLLLSLLPLSSLYLLFQMDLAQAQKWLGFPNLTLFSVIFYLRSFELFDDQTLRNSLQNSLSICVRVFPIVMTSCWSLVADPSSLPSFRVPPVDKKKRKKKNRDERMASPLLRSVNQPSVYPFIILKLKFIILVIVNIFRNYSIRMSEY